MVLSMRNLGFICMRNMICKMTFIHTVNFGFMQTLHSSLLVSSERPEMYVVSLALK